MKIAIVDDERPARSELSFLIREIEPDTEIMEADSCGGIRSMRVLWTLTWEISAEPRWRL